MKLNVVLITYNHTKFIQDSLRSILLQKTDFEFNVLVCDDQSTDDTLAKIKEYARNSTIGFRYLDADKNLGITRNYERAFHACDAEYIAVLEGDDFWTDPYRLQKHVDFLDRHLECSMSFNRYIRGDIEAVEYEVCPQGNYTGDYALITARDLARENRISNFSACVYRKTAIDTLPDALFELTAYDWITNIMVGKNGMIGCLTDVMSFYRVHSESAWSSNRKEDNLDSTLESIRQYDEFTNHLFKEEFAAYRRKINRRKLTLKLLPGSKSRKAKSALRTIRDLTPPILIFLLEMIVPPKIMNKMRVKE